MSVYDALHEAVADRLDVPVEKVAAELLHREVFSDWFWAAWDSSVSDALARYCDITGTTNPEDSDND